ncbi:potassium-transporting ATPase subunit KdpA [Acidimicrobiaceae bacterium USS-CC1]|uniref:Potassium-transporting ATPase potassium-binding subunit n=1 Tax=Acidiferrimicrobium australe TaxID=2664430 RepID=A0ABW9QQ83_9ACTN|nr:potassium-transporting ATPase subunit KdpA [Acidiferrimicrobium australe]
MTWQGIMQIVVLIAVVTVVGMLLGRYMFATLEGDGTFADRVFLPIEHGVYRLCGIDPTVEMRWTRYVFVMLAVNVAGFVVLMTLLALQPVLTVFNPAHMKQVPFWVNLNTSISFMTNTNWQNYGGETTLSYLSQMWLTVQQFLSPVTGICLMLAVVRGFSRHSAQTVGNFWRDFVRTLVWVAVPLAIIGAIVLVALGVTDNLAAYTVVHTVQGHKQVIAQGPVAPYDAIASLGDNGGGFFNANVGHPLEGPNAASAFFILILGFSVPVGCVFLFGRMVKDLRQARPIFATMVGLFLVGAVLMYHFEAAGNPALALHGIHLASSHNLEGKDLRFGTAESTLFNNSTTAVSWGAVVASNDSMTPLGGLIPLFNMMTGEVIFGSWGAGLIGMLAYAVLALFLAGLMVGRTPEYLGKKIEAFEVKMAVLSMIVPSLVILVLSALSVVVKSGLAGIFNPGPHGLSEILYAFSSGVGNNGSAFGGLGAALPWYSWTVGLAMLLGRFAMYIPLVAMGASLARKQRIPASAGTFPTHGPLFTVLLAGTVVIVGALIFFPALALGPFAEQFSAVHGALFGG